MKPTIIVECCQNHNGDRENLRRMIHAAAECGADFAKLQSIRSRELTHRPRFDEGVVDDKGEVLAIRRPFAAELERLSKLDLTLDDEAWFVDECMRAGIASATTCFTRSAVREVECLGFEAVKVASYDCASRPLLRDLVARWKRIFVSTGATYDAEIEAAAEVLRDAEFAFLHCVTIYPTPMEVLNLRRMSYLRRFSSRVGFSDHTLTSRDGVAASKIAFALGADVVERHFTLLEPDQTKDGPVSINGEQLVDLRAFADRPRADRMEIVRRTWPDWWRSVGSMRRELTPEELLNRDYYRGRFASKIGGRDVFNWEDVPLEAG
jgi:sialic acid synthase SpsE